MGGGENKRADWAAGPSVSFARASFVMCPAAIGKKKKKRGRPSRLMTALDLTHSCY